MRWNEISRRLSHRNAPWLEAVTHLLIPASAQSYLLALQKLPLAILCSQATGTMGIWPRDPETSGFGEGRGAARHPPSPRVTAREWSDLYFWPVPPSWHLPSTEENCFCHILQKEWFSSCSVCLQLSSWSFLLLAHGLHAWNSARGTGWNLWSTDSELSDLNINVGMRSSEATGSETANLPICGARNPYFHLLQLKTSIRQPTLINRTQKFSSLLFWDYNFWWSFKCLGVTINVGVLPITLCSNRTIH